MKQTAQIFFIILGLLSCDSKSQKDPNSKVDSVLSYTPEIIATEMPWNLECGDSAMTQTDMNICSFRMYKIADSILTLKFKSLDSLIVNRMYEYHLVNNELDSVEYERDTICFKRSNAAILYSKGNCLSFRRNYLASGNDRSFNDELESSRVDRKPNFSTPLYRR